MIKKTLALIAALVAVVAITIVPSAATASKPAPSSLCPPGSNDQDYCESPSVIRVASTYAVVFRSGATSVDLACFGVMPCKGTLTISHLGSVIASASYNIGGNDVGVVNLKLNALGLRELQSHPYLEVTVTAVDAGGPSSTVQLPLYRLS